MKVKDIITELEKCSPELDIVVFDAESKPYIISNIVIDTDGGELSHILIESIELT